MVTVKNEVTQMTELIRIPGWILNESNKLLKSTPSDKIAEINQIKSKNSEKASFFLLGRTTLLIKKNNKAGRKM